MAANLSRVEKRVLRRSRLLHLEVVRAHDGGAQVVDAGKQGQHVRLKVHDPVGHQRHVIVALVSGLAGVVHADGAAGQLRRQGVLEDPVRSDRIVNREALDGAAANHHDSELARRLRLRQVRTAESNVVRRKRIRAFDARKALFGDDAERIVRLVGRWHVGGAPVL